MSQKEETVVLVADDEPSTLALVTAHVRSKGFKVIEASDGDMAWQLAHQHLPDLVILDVMMSGMSGWEVCRKIRESLPLAHTGVVMLTGIGENLNEMTSPLYGADAHVDKPFEFSELDEKIDETLENRKAGAYGRADGADEEAKVEAEPDEDELFGAGVAEDDESDEVDDDELSDEAEPDDEELDGDLDEDALEDEELDDELDEDALDDDEFDEDELDEDEDNELEPRAEPALRGDQSEDEPEDDFDSDEEDLDSDEDLEERRAGRETEAESPVVEIPSGEPRRGRKVGKKGTGQTASKASAKKAARPAAKSSKKAAKMVSKVSKKVSKVGKKAAKRVSKVGKKKTGARVATGVKKAASRTKAANKKQSKKASTSTKKSSKVAKKAGRSIEQRGSKAKKARGTRVGGKKASKKKAR